MTVARGQFDDTERLLSEVRAAGGPVRQPQFVGSIYAVAAEAAIWQGRYAAARTAVLQGLAAIRGTEHRIIQLRLCALGLRNEADEWLRRTPLPEASDRT